MDRRSLIKRAAAAGALAWTAPVVIDSLASPAGAVTGECSNLIQWTLSSCLFTGFTNAQDCVPTAIANCPQANIAPDGFCASPIDISCDPGVSLTLTIPTGCSCVFISGRLKTTAAGVAGCVDGVLSSANKVLTFTTANPAARVSFYISC